MIAGRISYRRDNKRIGIIAIFVYFISTVAIFFYQLALGTSPWVSIEALLALIMAAMPIICFGPYDIASVFAVFLMSKYSIFPFFVKTLMGERIDVGLLDADKTFDIIVLGCLITIISLLLAKSFRIRKRIFPLYVSGAQLYTLGIMAYLAGFFLTFLHIMIKPVSVNGQVVSGFGGFGGFSGLLYLGIICQTAHIVSTKKQIIGKSVLLMLAGAFILSMLDNAKLYIALSILSYAVTAFLFGAKLSMRYILIGMLLIFIFLWVVTPTIQVMRSDDFRAATISQRVEMLVNFSKNHLIESRDANDLMRERFRYDYYPGLHSPVIDRLEMIQDLDLVVNSVNSSNTVGWRPMKMALEHITPSVFLERKSPYIDVDEILYKIGYMPKLMAWRRTLGLFGVSYAMFMWTGLIFVSLILLVAYFVLMRKLVYPSLVANVFGIYMLVRYGQKFSEIGVENMVSLLLRGILQDIIVIYILIFITKFMVTHKVVLKNKKMLA